MTPARAIAMLDRQLAQHGEDVTLRRRSGAGTLDVTCRARPVAAKAGELVGEVRQTATMLVLSPTQILAAGWPSGLAPGASEDERWPRPGDEVVLDGRTRRISSAERFRLDGTVVRINLEVTS